MIGDSRSDEIVDSLQALPGWIETSFPSEARKVLSRVQPRTDELVTVVEDLHQDKSIRFAAFYCAQTLNRQNRDWAEMRRLTDLFEGEFREIPRFKALVAEYYLQHGSSKHNRDAAAIHARDAAAALPNVPGVLHLAGEVLAHQQESEQQPQLTLILEGERYVSRALALSAGTYPKYFATLARLQALRGAFDEADQSVARAIEEEDSSRGDYAVRIGDYQVIRARIRFARESNELRAKQTAATEALVGLRRESFQLLGLLAAVIAFLSVSIQLTTSRSAAEAITVLLGAAGALVVVFAAFQALIADGHLRKTVVAAAVGSALIAAALWIAATILPNGSGG